MFKKKIITLGSNTQDIFIETGISEKKHNLCYPSGSKIQIMNLNISIGGGGINTSTTFSKMGLKTYYLGVIQKKNKLITTHLKKNKIKFIGNYSEKPGMSIILDSKEHNRTILTYKGDNDALSISDKKIKNMKADWIYFSSSVGKTFDTYIKIANYQKKKRKTKIVFNPSSYLIKKGLAKKLIKYTDILILNFEEASMLSKNHRDLLNLGPKIVIVTNGKKPFFCYTEKENYLIFPNNKIKIIERTGAGDAFASGFLASYVKTNDLISSLKIGNANSESVIQYYGSTNKILSFKQALEHSKKFPIKIIKKPSSK